MDKQIIEDVVSEWYLWIWKGASKSGAIFQKVCQKMEHFSEKGVKKWHTIQGAKNYLQKRCAKSGALFQKVCQKVAYFPQKCVKMFLTYENIRGFRGFP